MNGSPCSCGRIHTTDLRVVNGRGVLNCLADEVRALGGTKAFVLCDPNTYKAAGSSNAFGTWPPAP